MKRALMLAVAAGLGTSRDSAVAQPRPPRAKVLVAFFSRTGNTKLVARQIRRALDADLFEIEPADVYPEDYPTVVDQAQAETERVYEPPLRQHVPDIGSYEVIFLGFPIWGMTAPPVIRSFLSSHDLSGRTLVPFITHGGYGRGQSANVLAQHAPRARILDGFEMEADQERQTLAQVTRWLSEVDVGNQAPAARLSR